MKFNAMMELALLPPKGFIVALTNELKALSLSRCNFKIDCPNDSADEDGCPQFYSFEDCATPETCGWSTKNGSKELEWVIATADQVRSLKRNQQPLFPRWPAGHNLVPSLTTGTTPRATLSS